MVHELYLNKSAAFKTNQDPQKAVSSIFMGCAFTRGSLIARALISSITDRVL